MATTTNSKAAFEAHLRDLELDPLLENFKKEGWVTYGDFGFACSQGDNADALLKEVLVPLAGDQTRYYAKLRRLFAHSYVIAQSETQRFADQGGNNEPITKLHPAEGEQRREEVKKRITGFTLTGELDPSARLIDRWASMAASGQVRYLPWSRCTSSRSELLETPESTTLRVDLATGTWTKGDAPDEPDAPLANDLLLDSALRRRALAAEIADVCSYDSLQLWHESLKTALLRDPPPGFGKITHRQIEDADKELFRLIAERCRSGIKRPAPGQPTAFEAALKDLMWSMDIRMLLQPLPRSSGASSSSSSAASPLVPSSAQLQKLIGHMQSFKQDLSGLKRKGPDPSSSKGGGKGRKGKARADRHAPRELIGKWTKTKSGDPLCFNFNMNGCDNASAGGRCDKGWHLCAEPRCLKPHSLRNHS